jgi:hypothetical protein
MKLISATCCEYAKKVKVLLYCWTPWRRIRAWKWSSIHCRLIHLKVLAGFMHLSIYHRGKSPRYPVIREWLGSSAGLDIVARKLVPSSYWEQKPCPNRSQTCCLLSFPGLNWELSPEEKVWINERGNNSKEWESYIARSFIISIIHHIALGWAYQGGDDGRSM